MGKHGDPIMETTGKLRIGTLRDCILDRTPIDKETNQRIGMRAPSDSLRETREIAGADPIEYIPESRLLPGREDPPYGKIASRNSSLCGRRGSPARLRK